MKVSPLNIGHIPTIREIARSSFDELWSPEEFQSLLIQPRCLALGLFDDKSTLVAYFVGLLVQGELDIVSIATAPSNRRKGLAEMLLTEVLNRMDVNLAFLEVKETNLPAVRLYQKLGFKVTGKRPKYYQKAETALTMRWGA